MMTTKTRKSTPKDKFYRRYAAAYVLGIPTTEVPEHSWKALMPRIYGPEGVEPDPVLLEKFRTTKSMLKGLPGVDVIEMVTQAQASDTIEPAKIDKPEAKKSARKAAPKAKARSSKKAADDADAINQLYGNKE
jgi:ribosomal protein L12E/L44/L45/RPP1/RPP2